jgi:hypothetical protein
MQRLLAGLVRGHDQCVDLLDCSINEACHSGRKKTHFIGLELNGARGRKLALERSRVRTRDLIAKTVIDLTASMGHDVSRGLSTTSCASGSR